MVGAAFAELVSNHSQGGFFRLLFGTMIWCAAFAAILTPSLHCAAEVYHRRPFLHVGKLVRALAFGAAIGAASGAIAQAVYSVPITEGWLRDYGFRGLCWSLMGAIIGWKLSSVIPNLGKKRGFWAGALGGFVGGLGFIIIANSAAEVPGRLFGIAVLGLALGLAIVTVDEMFREAYLEVVWAPKEVTTVSLGPTPVFIGGGDDHIFVAGLDQHAGGIAFQNGKIEYLDGRTGSRTAFRDGSKVMIGRVEIVVHAKGSKGEHG